MHLTRRLHIQPGNDAEQRGFTAARRAEKADKLAFANVQVDVLQRCESAKLLADIAKGKKQILVHESEQRIKANFQVTAWTRLCPATAVVPLRGIPDTRTEPR